jgi:hypothetical protein
MKIKSLLPLLVSMILILLLVATSCAPTAGPTKTVTVTTTVTATPAATQQAAVKETFRAVNPAGLFIPVQTKALASRLNNIDGKTIYVCQGEADPIIMPALYKLLVKDYTKTTFLYYDRSDFGPNVPGSGAVASSTGQPEDPDILKKVQGVIRGIGW